MGSSGLGRSRRYEATSQRLRSQGPRGISPSGDKLGLPDHPFLWEGSNNDPRLCREA